MLKITIALGFCFLVFCIAFVVLCGLEREKRHVEVERVLDQKMGDEK